MGSIPEEQCIQAAEDRFGKAEVPEEIPLIDFSRDPEYVVSAVAKACQEWGFFQAINHSVSIDSLERVLHLSKEIFARTPEENQVYNLLGDRFQNLDDDPASSYRYGFGNLEVDAEHTLDLRSYLRLNFGVAKKFEIWPEVPTSFRDIMEDYLDQVASFGSYLLSSIISKGLGLEDSYDLDKVLGEQQIALMNYYLPYHKPELVKGASAHSDPRGITILLQDDVGGLEVCKDGRWFAVKPVKNALVVNVADHLEILTNGKYKSAEHRVRTHADKPRQSVVLFFGPAMDRVIGPLPEMVSREGPPRYRDFISKDYVDHFYTMGLHGKRVDYVRV